MNDRSVHIFDIYEHPDFGLHAVRRGFSWEAFLLPAVWAVRRGLGWTALTLLVLTTAVFDAAGFTANLGFGPIEQSIFMMAGMLLLGIKPGVDGYLWIGEDLVRKGYRPLEVIAAASRHQALVATANRSFTNRPIAVAA